MAVWRCVALCDLLCCLLLVFAFGSNIAHASLDVGDRTPSFTCDQVRELFEGDFGAPAALHVQPEQEGEKSICGGGRKSGHYTCCSEDTELKFAEVGEKRLKESVRTRNHALKKHLTNLLAKYQDRIAQLTAEAQNRTSVFLSRLHKIPWTQHEPFVSDFFASLLRIVTRGATADPSLEESVREFFINLFPPVFNYVLTVRGQEEREPLSGEYQACLKRYAEQIQPFGNQPDLLLKRLRHTVKHARVFQEALSTFSQVLTTTEAVALNSSCRHALLRLQVCPGCRGLSGKDSQVKPCRGMCLNVMRGCLAKLSEVSTSWDDLVVAFENVQVGMMGRHDLQKTLLYVDMNVSEAIMMAMGDSPRIYDEVRVKCRHLSPDDQPGQGHGARPQGDAHSAPVSVPLIPEQVSEAIPSRSVHRLQGFQQDVKALVKHLDDAKGMFHRLPDSLCQDPARFAQDMQSSACWNGSSVGRYMEQVPEANFLSQVQHNKEVKISLMDPDLHILQVKETLTHMRRNLSTLLNSEIMLGDGPVYKNVAGDREGSGHLYQPVIVDDEDLIAYGSGSGSGSGDDRDDEEELTTRPDDTRIQPRPTRPPTTPQSSSHRPTRTVGMLLLCVVCQRLLQLLQ